MQPVQTFSADLFLRMLVVINSNFFLENRLNFSAIAYQ